MKYFWIILSLIPVLTYCGKNENPSFIKNISWKGDGLVIRDQGSLGSCASFGAMGLVESNYYLESGISIDLAERYQIRSLILKTRDFSGGDAGRSMQALDQYGILPESSYPYQSIAHNKQLVFLSDGFNEFQRKIREQRSQRQLQTYIEQEKFLGPSPNTVTIPVKIASKNPKSVVPRVQNVPCFSMAPENEYQLPVSPVEFASKCIKFKISDYFQCMRFNPFVGRNWSQVLRKTLSILDSRSTLLIGTQLDKTRSPYNPFFIKQDDFKSENAVGHNMIVIGYLRYQDLVNPQSHQLGFLAKDEFDEMVTMYEVLKKDGVKALTDFIKRGIPHRSFQSDNERLEWRLNSRLAQLLKKEQGLLILKNSWSTKTGYHGFFYMTFSFFHQFGQDIVGKHRVRGQPVLAPIPGCQSL